MTKNETFSLCFAARKNKRRTRLTVSLRATINGERWEETTGCKGAIANWNKIKKQFVGDDAHQNVVLQAFKEKATAVRAELLKTVGYVNRDNFNAAWHKKAQNPGLLEVYAMIVDDKELQQSKGKIIMRSLEAYHRAGEVFTAFLASEQRTDIPIKEVDIAFARRFQAYLKAQDYAPGYIQKFFVRLRQCLKLAIEKGMIEHSAVLQYKVHKPTPPPPLFLSFEELHRLETTDFSRHDLQLQKAADVLIFCCHTGFSYKDAQTFSKSKHVSSLRGTPWISYPRGKTGTFQELELFPKAAAILDKYGGNQLPRISNQKVNFYLKQIAEICKINKQLTSHIGRKTAGTLWLNSGLSYEVVAVMLGHSSPEITRRHYARVNNFRVQNDINTHLKNNQNDQRRINSVL